MGRFQPGNGGRPKGAKNRLTISVKDAVLDAFNKMQESEEHNIVTWGKANPTDFYKIASKLIPTDVQAEINHKGTVNLNIKRGNRSTPE